VAVARAPAGSALVVEVGATPERGYWGEVLTTGAEARDLAGLVIDGGVRDSAALEAHRFPVFSSMVALRGATKQLAGEVGGSVRVGDATVEPGDWVVGDSDGVVVVAGASLHHVMAAGRARANKEAEYFAELRAGRSTLEILGLDTAPVRTADEA
jgi:4-hydroxy-4-methyl-2-oxoglutarate aldolase